MRRSLSVTIWASSYMYPTTMKRPRTLSQIQVSGPGTPCTTRSKLNWSRALENAPTIPCVCRKRLTDPSKPRQVRQAERVAFRFLLAACSTQGLASVWNMGHYVARYRRHLPWPRGSVGADLGCGSRNPFASVRISSGRYPLPGASLMDHRDSGGPLCRIDPRQNSRLL